MVEIVANSRIRSLVPSLTVSENPCVFFYIDVYRKHCGTIEHAADFSIVKFDTAKLPPILNALETTNNNQKLVLEVAVGTPGCCC